MEQIIHELQDMRHLSWAKTRRSSGTAGSFLKAYEDTPDGKIYYKLSNYDSYRGIVGHECVNEIIVDRLLTHFGIAHLSYQLIHAQILIDETPVETWLCASRDFKRRGESKIALDAYYQSERTPGETPLAFCIRNGWAQPIYEMLVVDYLILNRDRHGANMEVLRDRRRKTIRLAPLFDHGLSLLCRCETEADLTRENVMADKPVQCFFGSRSTWENLKLIPKENLPKLPPITANDKAALLSGVSDVIGDKWLEAIWQMLYQRSQAYASFCNQR